MKFSKNTLINFGEIQTLLEVSVIAINEKHYIKYINNYAKEMLALNEGDFLLGMPVIEISNKLKMPFFETEDKASDSHLVLVNDNFLKWQKVSVQVEEQEWSLFISQKIISKDALFPEMMKLEPNNINKELINLTKIIENLPELVYWKDKNYVYKGCNNHVAKLLNLSCPSEIIGKTDYDFGWSAERIKSLQDVDYAIIHQGINSIVEDIIPVAGLNKIFLTSKTPLHDEHGNITGILGISTDITERKKMEEDLRYAQNTAEAANEAKSDFISNMQHDLMTPFSGIHGAADLLYALYVDKYPELKEWLEPMMKSCDQLERIHYSMFDAIKLVDPSLAIEKFYLYEEINNVTEIMSAFLYLKHLKLITPNSSDLEHLGFIESNRLKVNLIILSLVTNAIKFTEAGQIKISVTSDETFFSLQIEDTGIGIPSDKFEYIFEKFTKLSRSNLYADNFKGIGAGLYIAKHHAHSIGGEIKVASELGKGSIFTLILPKRYKF